MMSSKPTKKRRKTKLVLREGIDLQDQIMDLQEEAVYNNPKIQIELPDTNENSSATSIPPHLQFSIKVEVEEVEEQQYNHPKVNGSPQITHPDTQDTQNLPKIINATSLGTGNEGSLKNIYNYGNLKPGTSLLKNVFKKKSDRRSKKAMSTSTTVKHFKKNASIDGDATKSCLNLNNRKPADTSGGFPLSVKLTNVNLDKVFLEADLIAKISNNGIDKILSIEIRNFWRRILRNSLKESPLETLLQTALTKWQMRIVKSWNTNPPLFYKCYVCNTAWWHLDLFRSHIKQHNVVGLSISLEESDDECNIVAHVDTLTYIRNIPVATNCYRCGKVYEIHITTEVANTVNVEGLKYACLDCNQLFYLCTDLLDHEKYCEKRSRFNLDINCVYCPFTCNKVTDYEAHLSYTHAVRSDIPITSMYKICRSCNRKYFIFPLHICVKKVPTKECVYCRRKFPSRQMVELHQDMTEDNWVCPVCKLVLPKKCMQVEHMVSKHSGNFMMAYKCNICTDMVLFLKEEYVKQHQYFWHKKRLNNKRPCYDKIIIPNKFIESMISQDECYTVANIIGSTNKDAKTEQKEIQTPKTLERDITNVQMNSDSKQIKEIEDISEKTSLREDLSSKMFQVTSKIREVPNRTEESLIEPVVGYEQDSMKSDHTYSSPVTTNQIVENNSKETNTDRSEVMLKYWHKSKVHKCKKCNFRSNYKEYKEHVNSECIQIRKIIPRIDINFVHHMCTKCGNV